MKKPYQKLCILLTTLALAAFAQSQPPLINCQGRLFDDEKALDGNVKMIMRIYDQQTGGRLLYEDTSTVSVVDGLYSTFLGDNTTKGSLREALAAPSSWLEVTANGITFTPRERLSSVPYATMAEGIRPGGITAEMIGPQSVEGSHIKDGSIAGSKLSPKSVTSIQLATNAIGTDHLADGAVTPPKLSQSYWSTSGNISQGGTITFIGTLDGRPLDFRVSNKRALRLEPNKTSPNLVGGHEINSTKSGVAGATIAGGGTPGGANMVKGNFATVGGGAGNLAEGDRSVVGGGRANTASGVASVVDGGFSNKVTQSYGTVGGGYGNKNEGYVATIGGGWDNTAAGKVATVSGGQANHADGNAATIGGGWKNGATGDASTVSGGHSNRAEGNYANIGGGTNNFVTGDFATIPGGSDNVASGDYSFATGRGAKAAHSGSVVFGGSQNTDVVSTAPDQFLIRAKGNVGIDTTQPKEKLTVAGNVQAESFIGDGSRLTGIATTPRPQSLNDAHIAETANIAPSKIAGTALTAKTNFQGDVAGSNNNLRIKPGAVNEDHLRPGLIDEAVQKSPLSSQVATLMRDAVRQDLVVRGDVVGTLDNLQLKKGAVGPDQLDADLTKQLNAIEASADLSKLAFNGDITGSYSNLQVKAGSIGTKELSREFNQDMAAMRAMSNPENLTLKGDLVGPLNNTQIKQGAIDAKKLAPAINEELAALRQLSDPKRLGFNGEVTGTYNDLKIKPGAIKMEKLSQEVLEELATLRQLAEPNALRFNGDVTGTYSNLQIRAGAVTDKSLAPGLIERKMNQALKTSDLATRLNKLQGESMTKGSVFKGDITGSADNLRIGKGRITTDNLSPALLAMLQQVKPDTLTNKTKFQGDVTGTADKILIKPGTITSDKLAPGLLTPYAKAGDLAAAVANLKDQPTPIRKGSITGEQLAPEVLAPFAKSADMDAALAALGKQPPVIADGSITSKKLAPEALAPFAKSAEMNAALAALGKQPPVIADGSITSKKLAPEALAPFAKSAEMNAALAALGKQPPVIADGSITSKKIAPEALAPFAKTDDVNAALAKLSEAALPRNTALNGDVVGPLGRVQIKQGSITADKLAPGLLEQYLKSSDVATSMSKLAGQAITKDTVFKGDVVGTVDGLKVKPEAIERVVNSSQITKQLAREIAKVKNTEVDTMKITQMIEGLQMNTLAKGTSFGGDVVGTSNALKLRDGSINARHFAPGAITLNQVPIVGELSPQQNVAADLGSSKRRWKGLYLDERIDFNNRLALSSGGVVRMTVDGEGNLTIAGLRTVGNPESPNIIGGHNANKIEGAVGAVISGGGNVKQPNLVNSQYGTIGGGFGNRVTGFDSTIGGGQDNQGKGTAGAISGGFMNITDGLFSSVGGGAANEATANLAVIAGGFSNKVQGAYATIPGGYQNEAIGDFSFAAGRRAVANHPGSFVWADATASTFGSNGINQFSIRASGGTEIYSNSRLTSGVKLNPGAGSWSMLSDRNSKDHLVEVDSKAVLDQLERLPLYTWNYKSQDQSIRHVGPTSQDFSKAFGVGADDTHISAIDADGVALSAIQGLIGVLREKEGQIQKLNEENAALRRRFDVVEDRVNTFFQILEELPEE